MTGPTTLRYRTLELRPLRRRDGGAWLEVRQRNESWLAPWEATPPYRRSVDWSARHTPAGFAQLLRTQRAQVKADTQVSYGCFLDGQLVGQVSVGAIMRGALNSAYVGYWVDRAVAGRGITPTAVALVADECFGGLRLHRLEANIRPENVASLRVVEKVGFSCEGRRRRYLAIDGDYRDHVGYALLAEDLPGGVLSSLVAAGDALR